MTTYFTSDHHFGHGFVSKLRGFSSTEEHDQTIAENWRSTVTKHDDVWVLGDLTIGSLGYALGLLAELPGRKNLICGNHDVVHPMHKKSGNHQRRYLEVFESVQTFARYRTPDQRLVLLSHFPYTADRAEPRGMQWRLPDLGETLFHGHLHTEERMTSPREIHVGLEAWGMKPVAVEQLQELMTC